MQAGPSPTPDAFPVYSRGERLSDAVIHVLGLAGALVAAPVMIVLAVVWEGDGPTVAAASIYGASLVAMFAASALYHLVPPSRWKAWLRRCDHAAIYVKIAGTYTPFAVLFAGEGAWAILTGMWAAAVAGAVLKVLAPGRFEWLTLGLYLAMGWAVLVIGGPILAAVSVPTLAMMVGGGVLYTVGVLFHLWDGLPYQNTIWHALVLAASFVFYAAVLTEVARAA